MKSTALMGARGGESRPRPPLGVLVFSFVLMVGWTLAVPIFEAPDEPAHWQYARYLHDRWRLPVYSPEFVEANSPPLYYLTIALLARPSEEPPPLVISATTGSLLILAPPRLYQNSLDDLKRYWPIRAARLVGVGLSILTILFCFLAGITATGRRITGLLAAALVAFLPQFTFRGMNVSNDTLVTMCAAATLYLVLLIVQRGFTWTRGLTGAGLIAAAFLSKVSAMFLPIPLALAILSERGITVGRRLRHMAVLLLAIALVAPWVTRNYLFYGDPLAEAAMQSAVAPLVTKRDLWSWYFLDPFPWLLGLSFVGIFGWMNLSLPVPIYLVFGLLGAAALFGCAAALRRGVLNGRLLAILASIPVLNVLIVVYINLLFTQPQGRYLFPALPALGVLAAIGLEAALKPSRRGAALLVSALAALNVAILSFVVIPAYWPPPIARISSAELALEQYTTGDRQSDTRDHKFHIVGAHSVRADAAAISADRYNFLQFEIEGYSQAASLTGAVHFTPDDDLRRAPEPFVFAWQADGARHRVTIPLFLRPEWHGRIRDVRIVGTHSEQRMMYRIDNVVLKGRLEPLSPSAASLRPRMY